MSDKSGKTPRRPIWWLNTFFVLGFALIILAIVGIISGEGAIRDPGQVRENGLIWMYLAGGIIMLTNGYLSHRQAVMMHDQEYGPPVTPTPEPKAEPEPEPEAEEQPSGSASDDAVVDQTDDE